MRSCQLARVAAVLVALTTSTTLGSCGSSSSVTAWSISGTVAGAVSQGVTMALTGPSTATATTDAAGHYAFTGLANGSFTVAPSLAGYTFDPASRSVTVSGADVGGQDFTAAAASGGFVATGSMVTGRLYHTATLLPNGRVLVAGGQVIGGGVLTSAEVYDPATGDWVDTGSLDTPRYSHTATLLPNGQVLAAGGRNVGGWLKSAELYQSRSGSLPFLPLLLEDD